MADFHFIRPLWLTAIIALVIAIYLLKKYRVSQSSWHQLLPEHLSNILVDGKQKGQSLSLSIPFVIGLLSIVALAGPTWKKLPQPVYQVAQGSVMIMDMSYSMYATDLTPNRLTRSRYKAIDLLNTLTEGDIGLIAYAGDAFVISPLTEDVNNIKLLLPSLTPDLMPELGSNPLSALTLAHEMLKNAGHVEGNIYWFTDGIDNEDIQDINDWSQEHPYSLNIMGVGTTAGAPIKLTNGELMKDDTGAIIIPKLPQAALHGVVKKARGNYVKLSNSDDDIAKLTHQAIDIKTDKKNESENSGDQWQEFGPYLLLLILPLVLGYFRRGVLLAILPVMFLITPSKSVYAANAGTDLNAKPGSGLASVWQDLWQTKDQQGQKSYNAKEYQNAAEQFKDPLWQGSAHYQAGNYEEALSSFQQSESAQALYNQGNALAQLQQLDQAIEAYDAAIAKAPNHQDAKANKALLEELKEQQEQQKNQDKDNEQNKDQDSDQDKQDQDSEQSEDQDSDKNKEKSDQESKDQQDKEQDSEENSKEQSEQDKQKESQEKEDSDKEKDEQEKSEAEKEQEKKEKEQAQQAKMAEGQLDKETQQKHQQLLNKVTDDPYLLLRNKMQLEYQKRRQNRSSLGVKKKW
ncbi:VWA domain-containing protein [bacterium]|nr:VWA domain-containing protein [bacterium]